MFSLPLIPFVLLLFPIHALAQYNFTIPPMLRFQCSQLVTERLDPLVNPGLTPSPHLHQIVGGNSFNATLSHDLAKISTCTSCTFSEDFSNYWTAVMYFRARNGTYKKVPQFTSEGLGGSGGITVYYIPDAENKTAVTAFKPGFRMLAGDAAATRAGSARKVCHRCMPNGTDVVSLNCAAPDAEEFPKGACGGGIRSVITFPTCWDGVNLDSPDHRSHVVYSELVAESNDVGPTGKCPESHPVVVPQVMFEVMWDTRPFNDPETWPEDGSQPFVWSTGDVSGYSQHGDYVFGWKDDTLQRAMDSRCTGDTCTELKYQSSEDAMECTIPTSVNEDVDGWLTALPGNRMPF